MQFNAYTPGTFPCSNYQIVTDSLDGLKSLRLEYNQAMYNAGNAGGPTIGTSVYGAPGAQIPASLYIRVKWRVDSTSLANYQAMLAQAQGLTCCCGISAGFYPILQSTNNYPNMGGNGNTFYNGGTTGAWEYDMERHLPNAECDYDKAVGTAPGGSWYTENGGLVNGVIGPNYTTTGGCQAQTKTSVFSYDPVHNYVTMEFRATMNTSGTYDYCEWDNGTFVKHQQYHLQQRDHARRSRGFRGK
jgi:hypothetical protein